MIKLDHPYVPVSQFLPEFHQLLDLYQELKPKTVLEIGSEFGGTLWHWLHFAEPDTRVCNIDLGRAPSTFPLPLMWQSWVPDGVSLRTIIGPSQDLDNWTAALEFLDWKPDFCFIDGDHTYKGVSMDWQLYGRVSKVTVFHDLVQHHPHFAVGRLFQELKEEGYRTEEFWSDGPLQAGGGIGVVYVR